MIIFCVIGVQQLRFYVITKTYSNCLELEPFSRCYEIEAVATRNGVYGMHFGPDLVS